MDIVRGQNIAPHSSIELELFHRVAVTTVISWLSTNIAVHDDYATSRRGVCVVLCSTRSTPRFSVCVDTQHSTLGLVDDWFCALHNYYHYDEQKQKVREKHHLNAGLSQCQRCNTCSATGFAGLGGAAAPLHRQRSTHVPRAKHSFGCRSDRSVNG